MLLLADDIKDDRDLLYELLRGAHSAHPDLAIVLLLDNYDRELVVNSLRAGARGLFYLVTEGLNNREIARELKVTENTVKKSLLRIHDKLGVSNRVELVLYALSHRQTRRPDSVEEGQPV